MEHTERAAIERKTELLCTAAQLILENGGETYRVEETARRMAKGLGLEQMNVAAMPTMIFIEVDHHAKIRRIEKRGTNLTRLARTNDVSRRVAQGDMTLEQAEEAIRAIIRHPGPSQNVLILSCGIAAGAFSLIFGGGIGAFTVACLIGMMTQTVQPMFCNMQMGGLFGNFAGGLIAALAAQMISIAFPYENVNAAIIGGIMPLLSGLLMTTAMRDTMYGDLISGIVRALEALLLAAAAALGVYAGLMIMSMLGGLLL